MQTYVAGTAPSRTNPVGTSCPGNMGGKNWPPTAYNPDHNIWYIPVIESCNEMTNKEMIPGESYKPREFFTGGGPRQHQQITGSVTAIDVASGAIVAKHETKYPMLGGILTTGGDLVFAGHPSGEFVALDAETLEELWRFDTGAGINAPPITLQRRRQAVRGAAGRARRRLAEVVRRRHRGAREDGARLDALRVLAIGVRDRRKSEADRSRRVGARPASSSRELRQRTACALARALAPERDAVLFGRLAVALQLGRDIDHHRLDLLVAQEGRRLGREVGAEVRLVMPP